MAKIHFIWWGPCPGDSFEPKDQAQGYANLAKVIATPVMVATTFTTHEVYFWCKADVSGAFTSLFAKYGGGTIRVTPITNIRSTGVANGDFKDAATWWDNCDENIVTLNACNAFSAIKDLLCLAILYAQGGIYLDTTTKINNTGKFSSVLGALPASPYVIGLPGEQDHQLLLQSGVAIIIGKDGKSGVTPADVPLIDVWCMNSPAKDAGILLMLLSYISRCNRMGLYPAGTSGNFRGINGKDEMGDYMRENLIGNLVIRSVYDGLLGETCGGDPRLLASHTWPATENKVTDPTTGKYVVASLGICKFHAGSWRDMSEEQRRRTVIDILKFYRAFINTAFPSFVIPTS